MQNCTNTKLGFSILIKNELAKKVDLKSSLHKNKKCVTVVTDDNEAYCGDHFTTYTNVESLFIHLRLI